MARFLQPLGPVIYQGLDVSELEGPIDFSRARADGRRVVYIRAGAGNDYADSMLNTNYENARAAGLLTGFFHQLTAHSAAEARQEAEFFLGLIAGKRTELRLAAEFTYFPGLSDAEINAVAEEFLHTIEEKSGKEAILIARTGVSGSPWNSPLAENYPLWAVEPGAALPEDDVPWRGWAGFRYSETGRADGVSGPVNLDRFTADIRLPDACTIPGPPQEPPRRNTKLICHTVAWGDTLWALARRYSTTVDALVQLNDIPNRNLIYPGQRLYVSVPTSVFGACCDSYTIRRGDTLSAIAARFSTTVRRIAAINRIADPDKIYPGEVIHLGLCP